MTYTFELQKDKITADGFVPLRLVIYHERKRIRKAIGAKTKIEDWNSESQIIENPRHGENFQLYKDFNKAISLSKEKVEDIFSFFKYNKIPFSEKLFNEKFESSKTSIAITFFDAYEEFIKISQLTKADSTIRKYKSEKNFLLGFQEYWNFKLRFDNIDYRFEEAFMNYCFNIKQTLNNTYAKHIKSLKAFLNWAFERNYHNSLGFKQLKAKEDEIEVIHLTKDELSTLYNYNFENPSMGRARDLFCLLCFTGQRHSDLDSVQTSNWAGNYLNFTVKKTKTVDHSVYLINHAKEILEKYKDTKYAPFPKLSSQKLNEKIQECCEQIGMTEEIILTRYIGARRLDQKFRKCDIITSHCGRKTYCTLSLQLGISERIVRMNTNHKEERNFRKYIKISERQNQQELEKWNMF